MGNTSDRHYLTHINALRGLAILLVFLYHLQETWCPNGYLGVDAFFVISGFFLIPGLLKITNKGKWHTLADYYRKKFLRIVPPTVVMVLLVLIASPVCMIWQDSTDAAKTARSVLYGISNIYMGMESVDYFSQQVKDNVLLHTWYISALLQILVVAPLICLPLSKLKRIWQYAILAVLTIASALIFFQKWLPNEWVQTWPAWLRDNGSLGSVYYMTLGRVWEVLIGAFIALLPFSNLKIVRTLLLLVGIALLAVLSFRRPTETGVPLFAVLATALVIRYGENTYLDRIFQNKVFMWLGTISFSLYLIHWPVIVLTRYVTLTLTPSLSTTCVCTAAGISLLLAWPLYMLFEKHRRGIIAACVLWLCSFGLAFTLIETQGLRQYLYPTGLNAIDYSQDEYKSYTLANPAYLQSALPKELPPWRPHIKVKKDSPQGTSPALLHLGNANKQPNFVLIGDSIAYALYSGFDIVAKNNDWSGLYLHSYVTPFWNRRNIENKNLRASIECSERKHQALLKWLKENPHLQYVILAQNWQWRVEKCGTTWDGKAIPRSQTIQFHQKALTDFCNKLKEAGKRVVIIGILPRISIPSNYSRIVQRHNLWYNPPISSKIPTSLELKDHLKRRDVKEANQLMNSLKNKGIFTLLETDSFMFKNGAFYPMKDGELLMFDATHPTVTGSERIIRSLQTQLNEILTSGS